MCISRTRKSRHRFKSCLISLFAVFWLPGSVTANANSATINSLSTKISLTEAVQRTLDHNPDIQAYPFYLRAAEGRALQADIPPNPNLGISVENVFGNGDYSGTDSAEYVLGLSQIIEMGGKRQQRVAFANASTQSVQAEYELTRLDVLAETSKRFYQLLQTQALIVWAENKQTVEQQALIAIERRARSGAVSNADVSNLKLHLARTTQSLKRFKARLKIRQHILSAMWLKEADFTMAQGSLDNLPKTLAYSELSQQIESFPDYIVQSATQRMADAQVSLARANGSADLELGAGIRQFSESGDSAFMLSASVPLQFSNPNRGRIKETLAVSEHSAQKLQWQKQTLALSLKRLWLNLESANAQVQAIKNNTLPLARVFQKQAEQAYNKGQFSVLQLLDANDQVFSLERELIEQQMASLNLLLEIERITGVSVVRSAFNDQN